MEAIACMAHARATFEVKIGEFFQSIFPPSPNQPIRRPTRMNWRERGNAMNPAQSKHFSNFGMTQNMRQIG
jgi:hypothetical protein